MTVFIAKAEGPISAKLSRGSFVVTFFLAVLAAMERDGMRLAEL